MAYLTDADYADATERLLDVRDGSAVDTLGRDRLIAYMRERGVRDLYFFSRAVLGMKDLTPGLHLEMCRFSETLPGRRKGYLIPRGHLKSSILTIADPLRAALRDPLERIGIFHEKATQAEQFLKIIGIHLLQNPLLRMLYPERVPPVPVPKGWRWTQNALNVRRPQEFPEPTFFATGQGSALQGMHFTSMHWDDLIGEEAAGNDEVMQKVIDWAIRAESLAVVPELLKLRLVGTRWGFWDFYSWAQEEGYPTMEWFIRSAIVNVDGQDVPLWPERFTMEALMELRRRNFVTFSQQYMNAPVTGTRQEFETGWLRYYRKETRVFNDLEQAVCVQSEVREEQDGSRFAPLSSMRVLIHVDPGLGITDGPSKAVAKHSFSVVAVVGLAWPRRVFLLHIWREKQGTPEIIDAILRFYTAYDRQTHKIVIERHSWTRSIRAGLLQTARERGVALTEGRIHDYTMSGHTAKDQRIRSLAPYFREGRIFLEEGHVELEREYRDFPTGKSKDILDALAQGPSENLWQFSEDSEESPWDDEVRREPELDRRALGASITTGY